MPFGVFLVWLRSAIFAAGLTTILRCNLPSQPIAGFPLSSYVTSIVFQLVIIPFSFWTDAASVMPMMVGFFLASMASSPALYAENLLITVNHSAAIACALAAECIPTECYWCAIAVVALEIGSGFYNLHLLFPDSPRFLNAYKISMTACHVYIICSIVIAIANAALTQTATSPLTGLRLMFSALTLGFIVPRQMVLAKARLHMHQ